MKISTYHKGTESAIIVKEDNCYAIEYYDINNTQFHKQYFDSKNLNYVEDAAENWALELKNYECTIA